MMDKAQKCPVCGRGRLQVIMSLEAWVCAKDMGGCGASGPLIPVRKGMITITDGEQVWVFPMMTPEELEDVRKRTTEVVNLIVTEAGDMPEEKVDRRAKEAPDE